MNEELKADLKAEIISWIKVIVSAVIFAVLISNFVIVNAEVPTGSMEDTIMPKDRVIAFRMSYLLSDPERFDVVVFYAPDEVNTLFVKRIIGLPGDTVDIVDGLVYINGSDTPLDSSFVKGNDTQSFGPYHVPEGCYFMMGDNREKSKDSRWWINTYAPRDNIQGKVIFKYFRGVELIK